MPEEATRQYKVRYSNPSWEVGANTPDVIPGSHYPDDYMGKVVAVLPANDKSDPAGAYDIVLELFSGELAGLRERKLKISAGRVAPTDLEDRWGPIAPGLRMRWGTQAEEVEKEAAEDDRIAEEFPETYNRQSIVQREFELEIDRLADALPSMVARTGTGYYATMAVPTKLDRTQSGAAVDNLDGTFTIALTSGGLGVADAYKGGYVTNVTETETAAVVSHTDDELTLEAHAGITIGNWSDIDDLDIYDAWSTIQGALDQLWIDQGATAFTASQYIRVFAGTYDENVAPNASLRVDALKGYPLIIEGDPADSRDNIIIAPTSGSLSIDTRVVYTLIRHMTVDGTAGSTGQVIKSTRGGGGSVYNDPLLEVNDCVVLAALDKYAVYGNTGAGALLVVDCAIFTGGDGVVTSAYGYYTNTSSVRNCKITRTGSKGGRGVVSAKNMDVRGCTTKGFTDGVYAYGWREAQVPSSIRNNTFYDCTYAMHLRGGSRGADVLNNIVDACDYAIRVTCWPDEASGAFGGPFTFRNNCFDYDTAFAYDGTGAKTYAQFTTFDRVDASGDLDATDPLLGNPGSGDFTLQAGSPCRRAGVGAGVTKDVNGDALCPYHPDIGSVSTGVTPWELIRANALK